MVVEVQQEVFWFFFFFFSFFPPKRLMPADMEVALGSLSIFKNTQHQQLPVPMGTLHLPCAHAHGWQWVGNRRTEEEGLGCSCQLC